MRLGATVGHRGDPAAWKTQIMAMEAAGVDVFFSGEAYTSDAVSAMGFLAAITERAEIASSILPIYTRTPTVLGMTAVGIDRLSGGRFILGLGASGPQVIEGFHGVPYDAPLQRTREIIEICRQVVRRDKVVHQGSRYQVPLPEGQGTGLGKPLKIMDHPVRDRVPIYVASLGPKNVEMTVELAEGWIPLHFWPERADRVWGEALATGTAKRAPELGPIEIVAGGNLAIVDDYEELREQARPMLTMYFGGMGAKGKNFYNDLLVRYGFGDDARFIQESYLGGRRKEAAARVPRELIDGTSLVGPAGWVRERIEAFRAAGVTVLNVTPVGPDPIGDLEAVKSWLA